MTRLIDTMTGAEVRGRLSPFFDGTCCYEDRDAWLTEELENLFAKEPHWSDGLSLVDNQSWVLCFVSDDSPEETRIATWIARANCAGYRCCNGCAWKYATPVDLNVRFKKGEE
mgnify:CR=1 FL=1